MSQSVQFANDDRPGMRQFPSGSAFEKLQQLTRQGYAPDPRPAGGGILLRHPSGPSLILREDGSIDLPAESEQRAPAAAKGKGRVSWRRTLLFVLFLMVGIFVGWLMTAAVLSS